MSWLRRLSADHANLRAAVRWSLRAKRPELGLRLASALGNHGGGLHLEIRSWLETTLGAAPDAEPRMRAKALLALGLIIGGGPAPGEHLHEALRLFRAESNAHGAAQALIALSIDTDQAGEQDVAGPPRRRCAGARPDNRRRVVIASALAHRSSDHPRASNGRDSSGNRAWRCSAVAGIASSCRSHSATSGFAAMAAGDYAAAAPVLEEAVAISEEVEDARVLPFATVNRGLLHVLQGKPTGSPRPRPNACVVSRLGTAAARGRGAQRARGDRGSSRRDGARLTAIRRIGRTAHIRGRQRARASSSA